MELAEVIMIQLNRNHKQKINRKSTKCFIKSFHQRQCKLSIWVMLIPLKNYKIVKMTKNKPKINEES